MYMVKYEVVLKSSWSNQAGIPKQILMCRNGFRFLEVSWAFQHPLHQYVYKILGCGYPSVILLIKSLSISSLSFC